MRLPVNANKVNIVRNGNAGLFPPVGFVKIDKGNDGAGDYYGFYWEFGKESQFPIICRLNYEEYSLTAEFNNLEDFLSASETDSRAPSLSTNLNDESFFLFPFMKAKLLAKNDKADEAIRKLEISVKLFGEFSDSWALLSEQYRKVLEVDKAEYAAINSIKANWAFGFPSKQAIACFDAINSTGMYKNEPLIKRKDLLFKAGGFNKLTIVDFEKLQAAIADYKEMDDILSYLRVKQNYGFYLNVQSKEVKNILHFEPKVWLDIFKSEVNDKLPLRLILEQI